MPNQFFSPEGDLENYFVTESWLIDQWVGDELWTWGYGNNGRLGNAVVTGSISTPVTTFAGGTNWKQVACGSNHTAAIKTDGTLWTWGSASNGQLGNAVVTGSISTPVTTFAGGTNWKQVACGNLNHTAAIKTDGTLWTWGSAGNGRLGNGATTGNISTPVTTFAGGTNWKQVACGSNHTAAIKTDGTLWTWGAGDRGQRGESAISYTEKTVTGSIARFSFFINTSNTNGVNIGDTLLTRYNGGLVVNVVTNSYIEMQFDNTQVLLTGDFVFALLPPASISTPVTTFAGGTNWKQVACGHNSTSAIKTDGTLWTWGYNISGQIGDNTSLINRLTPVTTFAGGTNWKQVTGGLSHTSAIKTDGTLWIWGAGGNGRLGNAVTTGNISTPVTTFAGGTNWKQVSGGSAHTAAVFSGTTPDLPIS